MVNNTGLKKGFTLVELLIVIVVIAILAAITIVAYNGLQDRSRNTASKASANAVSKKLQILQTVTGSYFPTSGGVDGAAINAAANADATNPVLESVIDNPNSVRAATAGMNAGLTAANAENGNVVAVWGCPEGANIYYWNYLEGGTNLIRLGQGCVH